MVIRFKSNKLLHSPEEVVELFFLFNFVGDKDDNKFSIKFKLNLKKIFFRYVIRYINELTIKFSKI